MVLLGGIQVSGAALDESVPPAIGANGRLLTFTAASMSYDPAKSLIELTGNVKIGQGETEIVADKAQIFTTKNVTAGPALNLDSVEKFVATGNVKIKLETGVATSDEAVFLKEKKILRLSGKPAKFVGGDNTLTGTITGDTITVDRKAGDKFEANGNVRIDLEQGVANSDRAVYFTDTNMLVLSGTPAKLVGHENTMPGTIKASTITLDLETGDVTSENVEGKIFPGDEL